MSANQRSHSRHAMALPVEVEYRSRHLDGMARDVSLGGMFIVCPEAIPFGERVQLRFELESLDRPVVTEAIVRWVDPTSGIGVQFAGLRALEVWALQQQLARCVEGGVGNEQFGSDEER